MKTVACIVIRTPVVFTWLGHIPIMTWTLNNLLEVRGIDRICCVAEPKLVKQAKVLLAKDDIEVVAIDPSVLGQKGDRGLDAWLSAANGPAADADVIVVVKPTSPFMPAAKIEACLRAVTSGKTAVAMPGRPTTAVSSAKPKQALKEAVDSVRVFRIKAPVEVTPSAVVPVSLIESLDVETPDEYIVVSALVETGSV